MTEERYFDTLRVVLKAHARLAAFITMAVCRKHPEIVKTIPRRRGYTQFSRSRYWRDQR
jgi:hypothetical protein